MLCCFLSNTGNDLHGRVIHACVATCCLGLGGLVAVYHHPADVCDNHGTSTCACCVHVVEVCEGVHGTMMEVCSSGQ